MGINVEEKKSENYSLDRLPSYWTKIENTKADAAHLSQKTGATIFINSLCEKYNSTPLSILTQNLLRGVDDLEIMTEEDVTLASRKSLHTIAIGKLDGVAVKMNMYVLRKNFCIYDFTYSAKKEQYNTNVKDFETLVHSFKGL